MLYAMLLLFLILIGIQNDLPARSSRSRESPVDAVVARRVHFLVQSLLGDLVGRRRLDLQSLDGLHGREEYFWTRDQRHTFFEMLSPCC